MNSSDYESCLESINVLISKKYQKKNALFLAPVDPNQVPGYDKVITRPMDLGTVRKKLENGKYSSSVAFWADVDLVFENALTYNRNRKETQFVVKLAEYMMKIVDKQKKKAKIKAKGGGGGMKLKLGAGKKSGESSSSSKPKLSLKLPSSKSDDTSSVKSKPSKPKLKLSLSLNKKKKPKTPSPPPPAAKPSSPPPAAKPAPAPPPQKITPKLRLNLISRGKELPKGVSSSSKAPPGGNSVSTSSNNASKPAVSKPSSSKAAGTKVGTTKLNSNKTSNKAPTSKMTLKLSTPKVAVPKASTSKTSAPKITATKASTKTGTKAATTKASTVKASSSSKPTVTKAQPTITKPTKKVSTTKISIKSASTKTAPKPSLKIKKPGTAIKVKSETKFSGKAKKITLSKSPPLPNQLSSTPIPMTPARKERCLKVLSGLKRRKFKDVGWFTSPVSDKAIVDDYKLKIPNPMDLGTIMTKLEKNLYTSITQFVLDLRRVFGNCLRFNTTSKDSLRPVAVDMLKSAEQLMAHFIAKPESPASVYPPLLYCWGLCISSIDLLLGVTNKGDGHQTAHFFLHPASYFFGGSFPDDYISKVSKPMDFGTITSNLIEGNYQSINDFSADCRLVINNCLTYYGGRDDSTVFTQQASYLNAKMSQQLDALANYDQSPKAKQARANAVSWKNVRLPKPPAVIFLGILTDLRETSYTDRLTKLSQPAMRPFEKAVDLTIHRDYLQFIQTPMDLEIVERKIKSNSYETPEDFEFDMLLIFKNCEAYNAPRKADQMVAMGKHGAKEFRKLFSKRLKAFENPEESKKHTIPPPTNLSKQKRQKTDNSKEATKPSSKASRASPAIMLSTSAPAPKPAKPAKSKSKSPLGGNKNKQKSPPNAPVPLHVAIAEVKKGFARRQLKFLKPWEVACTKFFKELMKHPWISVARTPKFIYHVPVPKIFPDLKEAYSLKVKNPMDLTTAEAKLQEGSYNDAQDFIDDVALVFANAITFNKDGRDIGDHVSIAYYDASIHLLRYTRWLSLEHLQKYLVDDDQHTDEPLPDGLPPSNWKLTTGNRPKAHEEMENIVKHEEIDGIEGDRFPASWMENETEKLLKALRHQSDAKKMRFFLEPPKNIPDYAAYIRKPMDWQCVQKNLKKRKYVKVGEVIDDLRLIFSNALKYNGKHKVTDPVCGEAYEAAIHMKKKLEIAINKMMLTVCDRIGREKVDQAMEDRKAEAAERAEEERKKGEEASRDPSQQSSSATETLETIRVIRKRKAALDMDMEMPFFDEDDTSHAQSHDEAKRQHERQQRERKILHKLSFSSGALLYARQVQSIQAKNWVDRMGKAAKSKKAKEATPSKDEENVTTVGSAVSALLGQSNRSLIKFRPKKVKKKHKHGNPVKFSFD